MLYMEAIEKDLMELTKIRCGFEYEDNQFSLDISMESFLNYCFLFLKDGLNNGE